MATTSLCTTCIRALHQQVRRELRHHSSTSSTISCSPYSSLTTGLPPHRQPFQHSSPPQQARLLSTIPPPAPEPRKPTSFLPSKAIETVATPIARAALRAASLRGTIEPYIAYGSTETLFLACAAQCPYTVPQALLNPAEPAPKNAAGEDLGVGEGWWFDAFAEKDSQALESSGKKAGGLGLEATFNTWAQIIYLHMYVLTVKLRDFPKEHAGVWHQNLLDHFFYAAEERMERYHGMSARGTRNKYLKDLWQQWRGVLLSYDEGLLSGDAVLGTAVWRNLFKGGEGVDVRKVEMVVGWLRAEVLRVAKMEEAVVAAGEVKWEDAGSVVRRIGAGRESDWMRKPFAKEDLEAVGTAGS